MIEPSATIVRALMVVALIAGFGIHLYRLDAQSLWHDEAGSLYQASQPISVIIGEIEPSHLPLFFIVLKGWVFLVGDGEFAARFLSVLAATITIPLLWWLGNQLDDKKSRTSQRWFGLTAASIGAVAPALLYYGQEIRMYVWLPPLALLAVGSFVKATSPTTSSLIPMGERLVDHSGAAASGTNLTLQEEPAIPFSRPDTRKVHSPGIWWIVHGVSLAMLVFAHYYGGLVGLVSLSLMAGRLVRNVFSRSSLPGFLQFADISPPGADRRPAQPAGIRDRLSYSLKESGAAGWLVSVIIASVLVAPWILPRLMTVLSVESASAADLTPLAFLWRTVVGFLLGHHLEQATLVLSDGFSNQDYWTAFQLLLPLGALLAAGLWPSRKDGWPVIATFGLVPLIAVYVFTVGARDFGSRYLMAAAPAVWLFLALGIVRLGRIWKPLAAVGVLAVALTFTVSFSFYQDPAYYREDNRGLTAYVTREASADDAVLMNAGYNGIAFSYYDRGHTVWYPVPSDYPPNDQKTVAELERLAASYERLWLMLWQDYYSDPRGVVKTWLDTHIFQIDGQVFHGLTLYRYLTKSPIMSTVPPIKTPADSTLGDQVRFLGYDLLGETSKPGIGTSVRVRLYWQSLRRTSDSLRVAVQVVNPVFHVFGQKDNRPVYDRYPTDRWEPGQVIADDYQIAIVAGTPPGQYQLAISMYDPVSGRRLPVAGSNRDYLLIGPLTLSGSVERILPSRALGVRFGDTIELAGYDLAGDVRPGSKLHLTLYWHALGDPPAGLTVFTHVTNAEGTIIAQKDSQPVDGTFPTDRWVAGMSVRDQYDLDLPAGLPEGRYTLLAGMYSADGQRLAPRPGRADRAAVIVEFGLVASEEGRR